MENIAHWITSHNAFEIGMWTGIVWGIAKVVSALIEQLANIVLSFFFH